MQTLIDNLRLSRKFLLVGLLTLTMHHLNHGLLF